MATDTVMVKALVPIRVRRERDSAGNPTGRPVRIPIGTEFAIPVDELKPLEDTHSVARIGEQQDEAEAIRRDAVAVSQGAPLSSLATDEVRANAEAAGLGGQGKDLETKPGEEAGANASKTTADSLADAKQPAAKAAKPAAAK